MTMRAGFRRTNRRSEPGFSPANYPQIKRDLQDWISQIRAGPRAAHSGPDLHPQTRWAGRLFVSFVSLRVVELNLRKSAKSAGELDRRSPPWLSARQACELVGLPACPVVCGQHVILAAHAVVTQPAKLRARDLPIPDSRRRKPHARGRTAGQRSCDRVSGCGEWSQCDARQLSPVSIPPCLAELFSSSSHSHL
jgi:hypothetical protein